MTRQKLSPPHPALHQLLPSAPPHFLSAPCPTPSWLILLSLRASSGLGGRVKLTPSLTLNRRLWPHCSCNAAATEGTAGSPVVTRAEASEGTQKRKLYTSGKFLKLPSECPRILLVNNSPPAPAPAPALTHRTCPHHMATSLPPLAPGPPKAPTSNSQVGREGQGSKFVATHPVTLRLTQGPS